MILVLKCGSGPGIDKVLIPLLLLLFFLNAGCGHNGPLKKDLTVGNKNVTGAAERFSLEKSGQHTILTIKNPWQGAANVNQVCYLVKRGEKLPDGADSTSVIFVPIRKIICTSTTHVAMISALGKENTISGMSGLKYLYDSKVRLIAEDGGIAEVGYDSNLNKELIVEMDPDLVMLYGIGSESAAIVGKLRELGIKVLFNADYLEAKPLQKAEWIKVFGALYCLEGKADSIFNAECNSYNAIKTLVKKTASKPKVLLGLPFRDTWYISPGNSFISNLISDSGGEYMWQSIESDVSMPLGIEAVYHKALDAEFWLNIGSAKNKDEITSLDPRLGKLPCFIKGNMFNNNKRISATGGNDYWESGSAFPHLVLKDIASILHPELFRHDDLYYYRKLN